LGTGDFYKACWVTGDEEQLKEFKKQKYRTMATDKHGRDVYLAETSYSLQMAQQNYPKLQFHFKSEI